jgi:D-amino peptidase
MVSKKYVIRCDMEGVTGVVSYAQVEPGKPEYFEAQENFMQEILALVAGLQEAGADEVIVYDEHWFGRNLQVGRLPKGVTAICGKPPYREDWAGELDGSCTGMIIHGLHSKAGSGHLLHHTYEPDFAGIEINGVAVGEIGVEAAIAGDFGVPVPLIIADSAGAQEGIDLLPGIRAVSTKRSESEFGAVCLPLCTTTKMIKEAAFEIVKNPPPVKPLEFKGPVKMEMEFRDGPYLDALRKRAAADIKSASRLVLEGPSVTSIWARYWALKLQCQKDASHVS